ncbi:MAG: YccF domain-containing protein [Oscillospiraceae bacterium]|nr:YccF domain-containing protein [Oscillospiraceae bacterium]
MKFIGNIIWVIFGGFIMFLFWLIVGLLWCVTIAGIPVGVQCFKMAKISLFPFGKEIIYGGGAGSLLLNILWIIFGGIELAATALCIGLVCCVTIIGIPFGLQYFKIAKLALLPFGASVKR